MPAPRRSPALLLGLLLAAGLAFGGYWFGRQAAPDSTVTAPLPPASDAGPRLAYRSLDDRLTEPPLPPPPPAEAEQPAAQSKAPARPKRRLIRAQPKNSHLAAVRRSQEAAARPRALTPPRPLIRTSSVPVGKSGEVVLLGTFASPGLADSARARLVTRYPYLGTLPKVIAPLASGTGRRTVYQLKMGTGSRRNARTLCRYMLSIGRGCAVV